MKSSISILAILLFSSLSWGQTVEVSSFTEVYTNSGLNVHLIKSNEERVVVEMGKGDFKDLRIEVRNNRLHIKVNSKGFWSMGSTTADIDVFYKHIDELDASSGASIDSEEVLQTKKLDIEISSGASIKLDVDTERIGADISSGSSLSLSGYTDKQRIDISSGASYQARKLKSKTASVEASSGSNVTVNCTEEIKAEASSGATIDFYGNPSERILDPGKWSGGNIKAKS